MPGGPNIEVSDRQTAAAVSRRAVKALVAFCLARLARGAAAAGWGEVSVALADDALMTGLNARYGGRRETTDVLSFRYAPLPGQAACGGEIFVNVELAARAAPPSRGGTARGSAACEPRCRGSDAAHAAERRPPGPPPARARAAAWGFERELALYLAHACDHLGGADDADAPQRRRMRRRELRWLREADRAGLLEPLACGGPGAARHRAAGRRP